MTIHNLKMIKTSTNSDVEFRVYDRFTVSGLWKQAKSDSAAHLFCQSHWPVEPLSDHLKVTQIEVSALGQPLANHKSMSQLLHSPLVGPPWLHIVA